jgi:hypothetical protein
LKAVFYKYKYLVYIMGIKLIFPVENLVFKYRSMIRIVEKNEMGGACSSDGGRGEACTGFWWGNLRERDHLKDPGIDGRIILRWIFRK